MNSIESAKLRERAKRLLDSNSNTYSKGPNKQNLNELLEELRIYQAELEIQNDELRHAYTKIEESKTHYQKLFHDNPLPCLLIDKQGVIHELNVAAMSLLKIHYPSNRLRSLYHFTDAESGQDIASALNKDLGSPQSNFEIKFVTPEPLVLDFSISQFQQDKNFFYLVVLQDVTQQRKLLNDNVLLSRAVAETTAGIVITDHASQVIWINNAFSKLTGYSFNELNGKRLGPFLHGENTNQETIIKIRQALSTRTPIDVDIINYRKDGQEYWVNLKISCVFGEIGEQYFVGIQHDVTEQKKQLKTIMKLQQMDMIGQMAAGVAHDFNNILSIISGNCEIAALKNKTTNIQTYFENIKKSIERGKSLTRKLLKSSKSMPIEEPNGPLSLAIKELKALTKEAIPNNIVMHWHTEPHVDVRVSLNELQDVLLNIILNARNAISHHGNIDVIVSEQKSFNQRQSYVVAIPKSADSFCVISVKDNGCGIPKNKFERIFLPFESFSQKNGTGLGLAMVLGFVERSEFGLTIESNQGIGTEISIWIPNDSRYTKTKSLKKDNINTSGLPFLRILVVDDETDISRIIKEILELKGHTVSVLDNGDDALSVLKENSQEFDLVITDEIMPGNVQGHDILREVYDTIPVIIMSGYVDSEILNDHLDQVLPKPFDNKHLEKMIKEVMEKFNN